MARIGTTLGFLSGLGIGAAVVHWLDRNPTQNRPRLSAATGGVLIALGIAKRGPVGLLLNSAGGLLLLDALTQPPEPVVEEEDGKFAVPAS